ncbi:phenylalanine--tRNA ligase subunit alpha [Clostridium sp. 'deep sea']|uniref:phenylalanine--tRNA ligase subunit alpha n=1 Tax=Clostridium sp. 'deep sea' TaxID=2779445 RepID=UPI001896A45A|nr:phenylalanine--tRNA ligase subunit alpha [Clostridium sp. 'deep sea']QOR35627.1 phenylalanine--tRNA ligase subunit alpha [Clostridium sp. 'deep sea']
MEIRLNELKKIALEKLQNANSLEHLEEIRVQYLSKKGELRQVLRGMGKLDATQRPIIGKLANEIQNGLESVFNNKVNQLNEQHKQQRLAEETLDITLPGKKPQQGHRHPLNMIYENMVDIFVGMGFEVREGREIETDYYCFEALNIPKNHPARDMQDTFYINDDVVLRTHTSPMQIHTMEEKQPNEPVKIICPGRVYRRDDDATHSPMFHQIEGLVVGPNITMADLKGTLEEFFRQMFSVDTKVRLRPSYFPFTEPSAEVDITCVFCKGKGCKTCKQTGWIEVLGSGMVHPNVLRNVGYDPEQVSGFAFGMGIDRMAMLKLGINDLRLLFQNDLRMIEQY